MNQIRRGRNFLMTPGPTNVPERVLAAMMRNAVDLGGAEFVAQTRQCLEDLKPLFKTDGEVFGYIANGHGAWEAALVNMLAPEDRILVPGTGQFSETWAAMAEDLGFTTESIDNDWRHPIDAAAVAERLEADRRRGATIKAVMVVHTDTATGITSDVPAIRAAIDSADHPALLLVDTVASLATTDFRQDDWRVDVAVGASQKGLMMPVGLSFTAVSKDALKLAEKVPTARSYWDWRLRREEPWYRWFCGTAPEHLIFALREAIDMLNEEGLAVAFARHRRLANATQAAVAVWGEAGSVALNSLEPGAAADSITAVRLGPGHDANEFKQTCYEQFNVSLGGGLGRLDGTVFRIAHMGDTNEPFVLGALASVEATLALRGIPHGRGGVEAAIASLVA